MRKVYDQKLRDFYEANPGKCTGDFFLDFV